MIIFSTKIPQHLRSTSLAVVSLLCAVKDQRCGRQLKFNVNRLDGKRCLPHSILTNDRQEPQKAVGHPFGTTTFGCARARRRLS